MSDSHHDDGQQGGAADSGDAWLESRVVQILAAESDTPAAQIDRDTRLFDLGDSLTRVEIVMTLEDEFELSISDDEAERIKTVGELIDAVRQKLAERKQAAGS